MEPTTETTAEEEVKVDAENATPETEATETPAQE